MFGPRRDPPRIGVPGAEPSVSSPDSVKLFVGFPVKLSARSFFLVKPARSATVMDLDDTIAAVLSGPHDTEFTVLPPARVPPNARGECSSRPPA